MISPTVIGLYGVSGSGKSWILSELQRRRPEIRCVEGSDVLRQVLAKEGIQLDRDFDQLSLSDQEKFRNLTIATIRGYQGITVVAGHAAFLENSSSSESVSFRDVITDGDKDLYHAILYVKTEPTLVYERSKADNESGKRSRPPAHIDTIQAWIHYEYELVKKDLCLAKGIFCGLVEQGVEDALSQIEGKILPSIFHESEKRSVQSLQAAISKIPPADVYLLLDGDRTLAPIDSGKIFVSKALGRLNSSLPADAGDPLKQIFQRQSEYSWKAFAQVALLYDLILPVADYKEICQTIATEDVDIFTEWKDFLSNLPSNVHPVVITSGIANVWRAVLTTHLNWDDHDKPTVIAGNHVSLHPYVVDCNAKAMVVEMLREQCRGCHILAFGDSIIDAKMLQSADRGYIVLDKRGNTSLQTFVRESLENGVCANLYQLPLSGSNILLPTDKLIPGIAIGSLVNLKTELESKSFFQATNYGNKFMRAQLLASESRRSDFSGPTLQAVHHEIGRYLADQLVDRFPHLVQSQSFPHVQGTTFEGFATVDDVLILPLMRGGEPMSRGVYQRFPGAKLEHYTDNISTDRLLSLLSNIQTIIIVDSVINQGRSIRRCLGTLQEIIHSLSSTNSRSKSLPQLVVLTAVMQANASVVLPQEFPRVRFLALRVSKNQYSGKGGTDTGNRLFGTM